MNSLIDKYRKDELAPEELLELRKNTLCMTDEKIEQQLHANWLNSEVDISSIDDGIMGMMKHNIDSMIGRRPARIHLLVRWSRVVAILLLPLSILCSIYFYRENNLILSEEMLVTTGKTERVSITLPDGTIVSLNSESVLGYRPKGYNKKERTISFSGEGYFQVQQDRKIPFFINADGLQIEVLGTVFNLSVREKETVAELTLEEGSASLLSIRSNQSVVLQKNQKAILNQLTGNITVITDENIKDVSAWRRGDMIFRNVELEKVIRTIEKNYNITIKTDCVNCLSDPFTGTLPVNDLNEVLEIIERSYHLKTILNGKEIVMKEN